MTTVHCVTSSANPEKETSHGCTALTKSIMAAFAAERAILCSAATWISVVIYATVLEG